jgi:CubicO group peptidase (beta-lactamase class C family)
MIVPTEFDSIFRKLLIHGTVHDEAASLMGGISGNAGLFGNASEIGKLLDVIDSQNNNSILNDSTISKFTSYAYPNSSIRRGLGFDKPHQFSNQDNYPNKKFSKNSFGHTGFTGTFFWVDPSKKIKIVFLTNRVYPSRKNEKLFDNDIRNKLIDILLTSSKSIQNE